MNSNQIETLTKYNSDFNTSRDMNKEQIDHYLNLLNINKRIKSIDDVNDLIKAHIRTFPFTSIPVVLKEDISLNMDDIFKKIVIERRGGYCFEHNKLIYKVLRSFAFKVKHYFARIINNQEIITPLTHRITIINYKGKKYVLDAGVGYITPAVAVNFEETPTPSHLGVSYRVKENDGIYSMQMLKNDTVYTMYRFDLHPCHEIDFELGNFYSYKHPKAVFVNNMVLSSIDKNIIRSLRNDTYIKIYEDRQEEIKIGSQEKLEEILDKEFKYPISKKETELLYKNFIETNPS